jgi:NhaP-type Na+/H+ or K+/H+ antiporter
MSVSWFLIGLTLGVTVGLLYGWLIMRRLERHVASLDFTPPAARRALRDARKPW